LEVEPIEMVFEQANQIEALCELWSITKKNPHLVAEDNKKAKK
jgi:hypothetical protein